MNKKLKRVIAIIALVSMALFSVAFVLYLFDNTMLNGGMGAFALFFGGLGLALFFVLKLSRDNTDQIVEQATSDGQDDKPSEDSEVASEEKPSEDSEVASEEKPKPEQDDN